MRKHVLLVEDQALVAEALTSMIAKSCPNLTITARPSFSSALRVLDADECVDLLVLDLPMSGIEGLELIGALRCHDLSVPVIFVSECVEPWLIRAAVLGGADGFVSKSSPGAELVAAIGTVLSGGRAFTRSALACLAPGSNDPGKRAARPGTSDHVPHTRLGHRQLQVMHLVADGLTNREISESVGITEATVRYHMGALLRRFGAPNRTACIRAAYQEGLLECSPRGVSGRSEEAVSGVT